MVNKDLMKKGLDPEMDLSTCQNVLDAAKGKVLICLSVLKLALMGTFRKLFSVSQHNITPSQ